jgi:protein phosphatase
VAARVAAESVSHTIEAAQESEGFDPNDLDEDVVESALRSALSAVERVGRETPELAGLATTVTVLLVHGHFAVIGHCGDSRLYLIRDGRLSQLTVDHGLTTERPREPSANAEAPDYDVFRASIEPGDTLVLCSDGAAAAIQDPTIVRAAGDLSPGVLSSRIVSAANRLAPDQDSTAVTVRALPSRRAGWLELSGRPHPTRFGHMVNAWSPDSGGDAHRIVHREAGGEESD